MCMDAEAAILFQPCGHRVVCSECSVRMKKCFLCHQLISSKLDLRIAGTMLCTSFNFDVYFICAIIIIIIIIIILIIIIIIIVITRPFIRRRS